MNLFFDQLVFAKPFFLWLLLALPILWFRARDRRVAVLIARSVILALVILTLAEPQRTGEQSRTQERIFAYDISDSVPASMRDWMKNSARPAPTPNGRDRVFVFGSTARETDNWKNALDHAATSGTATDKTNLESLFNTLLALPTAPRNLYLFTDGWENQGNVEHLLPAIAAAGLKVYPVVPAGRPAIPNVAITKLLAPSQGNSSENLNLRAVLENQNDRPVEGTLTFNRNNQPVKTQPVKLNPGSQTFTFQTTPGEGPLTSFQATFTPRDNRTDLYSADNHAVAWVSSQAKAKVLLINGRTGTGRHLEEIIRRQGFEVTVRRPEDAPPPAAYKTVIFNNAERDNFPAGY